MALHVPSDHHLHLTSSRSSQNLELTMQSVACLLFRQQSSNKAATLGSNAAAVQYLHSEKDPLGFATACENRSHGSPGCRRSSMAVGGRWRLDLLKLRGRSGDSVGRHCRRLKKTRVGPSSSVDRTKQPARLATCHCFQTRTVRTRLPVRHCRTPDSWKKGYYLVTVRVLNKSSERRRDIRDMPAKGTLM